MNSYWDNYWRGFYSRLLGSRVGRAPVGREATEAWKDGYSARVALERIVD